MGKVAACGDGGEVAMDDRSQGSDDERAAWSQVPLAGMGGFLQAPFMQPAAAALRAAGATHAVYGIPFDGTTFFRTGSLHGPQAIRSASAQFLPYHFDFDIDLGEALTLVDCGNAATVPGNAAATFQRARADLAGLYAAAVMPIVLGGEHSVTIPATAALAEHFGSDLDSDPVTDSGGVAAAERGGDPGGRPGGRPGGDPDGPLALVVFDTHLDTAVDVAGETLTYCAPVSRTLELAQFSAKRSSLIGIHGPANPREELDWAREHGLRIYSMEEIEDRGIATVTEEAMRRAWGGGTEEAPAGGTGEATPGADTAARGAGTPPGAAPRSRGVYVSIDIDVLDASAAPGTSGAEPGGLTTRELLRAARIVGAAGFSACDVVEVAPQYDPAGITAAAACRVILDLLASHAAAGRRE
jgi:arginase family enzyme